MANVRFGYIFTANKETSLSRSQLSVIVANRCIIVGFGGKRLGLIQSSYRAHRAVVPAIAWHLVI